CLLDLGKTLERIDQKLFENKQEIFESLMKLLTNSSKEEVLVGIITMGVLLISRQNNYRTPFLLCDLPL
nr:hypothetical protein [Bacilli bacterium]